MNDGDNMRSYFSNIKPKKLERWMLRVIPDCVQPLPNTIDIGSDSIILHFCIYNETEYKAKLSKPLSIDSIEALSANSLLFNSEGHFPWKIGSSDKLEYPITKEEYNDAYSLIIWSDPFGSASFQDITFRKGVSITTSLLKKDESISNTLNHVIELKLKITESVISYFIDLVMAYSSSRSEFLKEICNDLNSNERRHLTFGKLGVISPSIGANNTKLLASINNAAEKIYGSYYDSGVELDLYDLDFWYSEYANKQGDTLEWGDTKISLYDFKEPIRKYYGAMFRIGNDAKIYSNEGLSNLDWGILSYQTGIGSDSAKKFADMDPHSRDQIQDDIATDEGYNLARNSANGDNKPVSFDRRKLFFNTVKTIQRTGGYYTHLEVQIHKRQEKEREEKIKIESTKYFMHNK